MGLEMCAEGFNQEENAVTGMIVITREQSLITVSSVFSVHTLSPQTYNYILQGRGLISKSQLLPCLNAGITDITDISAWCLNLGFITDHELGPDRCLYYMFSAPAIIATPCKD